MENIFQHSSTKVFWTSPKEDYAAHYAICKFGLRGPFWAAPGKPGDGIHSEEGPDYTDVPSLIGVLKKREDGCRDQPLAA